MTWGGANRPGISTKIGRPTNREGADGDIQIKGTGLGAKLFAKWSSRWWDVPLSIDGVTKIGTTDSDYLSIDRDSVDIYSKSVKVASFGATTTVKDINLTGKIGITSDSTRNICIGTWSTGDPDVSGSVDNIAIGVDAGDKLEDGAISNVLIGTYAGKLLATGYTNVSIGYKAGEDMATTYATVNIGNLAGSNITGGLGSICIGHNAGGSFTGSNYGNIYMGTSTASSAVGVGNEIVIAGGTPTSSVTGKGANTMLLGNDDVTDVYMGEDSQAKVHCSGIGIGVAAPANELHIYRDGGSGSNSSDIWLNSYNTSATGSSTINLAKIDNTIASPQAVGDNDILGIITFSGWDNDSGGVLIPAAYILARIDGTPSNENMPCELEFWTNTGAIVPTKRLTIKEDGDFVGSSSADISDERLKTNITSLSGSLDKINQLRGVSFTWKPEANKNTDKVYLGLIAQEVESYFPDVVRNESVCDTESTIYKSLHYTGLIAPMIKAIQELSVKLDTMQTEINNLKAE